MICLTRGSPGKEHAADKLLPKLTGEIQGGLQYVRNLPETFMLETILTQRCMGQKGPCITKYGHEQDDWQKQLRN